MYKIIEMLFQSTYKLFTLNQFIIIFFKDISVNYYYLHLENYFAKNQL